MFKTEHFRKWQFSQVTVAKVIVRPNIRWTLKRAKKEFEEKWAKDLNSVLYSHQKKKAWKKDSSQKDYKGINRAIKEDKDIANKLNHSFISIFAQYAGRYWFPICILNFQIEGISKRSRWWNTPINSTTAIHKGLMENTSRSLHWCSWSSNTGIWFLLKLATNLHYTWIRLSSAVNIF